MGDLVVATAWADEIRAWEAYLRAANRPATTRELRTYHLRRLAHDHRDTTRWRGPYDLRFEDLIAWLGARPWSAETRRSYRASIRQFYAWAHATGRVQTNPAFALPTVRPARALPRPAPDDVVRDALAYADQRARLMLLVLAQTGMRRGELARLHTDDVERDLAGWSLRILGKGGHTRLVPISDELAATIRRHPAGYVFPSQRGAHLSASAVGRIVSDALGPGWTAHTLRHRFATRAYSCERDLRAVQELLGHAKPETTAVYTLVPDDARRRAALAAAAA